MFGLGALAGIPGALASGVNFLIGTPAGRAILIAGGIMIGLAWSFNKGAEHEAAKCQAEAMIAKHAAVAQELETARQIMAQQKQALAAAEAQESEDVKGLEAELKTSQERIAAYEKFVSENGSSCQLSDADAERLR